MKLYVYSVMDHRVVAIIEGPSREVCDAKANELYDIEDYGWTYSPDFGVIDGVLENDAAETITVG